MMQGNVLTVENSIGVAHHPFAEINVARFVIQRDVPGQMPVAKYQVVVVLCLQQLLTVNNQPFLLPLLVAFYVFVGNSAISRPIICYADAKIGMYARKGPLTKPAPEHFF